PVLEDGQVGRRASPVGVVPGRRAPRDHRRADLQARSNHQRCLADGSQQLSYSIATELGPERIARIRLPGPPIFQVEANHASWVVAPALVVGRAGAVALEVAQPVEVQPIDVVPSNQVSGQVRQVADYSRVTRSQPVRLAGPGLA